MVIFTKWAVSREINFGLVGITGNTSPKDVEVQLSTQIGPVAWDQDGDHRRRPQISQRTKHDPKYDPNMI